MPSLCQKNQLPMRKLGIAMTSCAMWSNDDSLQQTTLVLKLRLLGSDGPNQDSKYCFGYDVCDRISDLLPRCCRHHVEEWNHGKGPPLPPRSRTILDLAWVAESHHGCRSDTQFPALLHRLLGWQAHDKDELNQEERDCENPIDIPVGIPM